MGGTIIAGSLCIKETGAVHSKFGKERIWVCPYCSSEFIGYNYVLKNRSKCGGDAHCGCQTKERQALSNKGRTPPNKLDDLTASANKVYSGSTKISRTFSIDFVKMIIQNECHYCNAPPSLYRELGSGKYTRTSSVPTNGIDRMDSMKGYHGYNCVACCSRCNYLKSDMPYDDFISICKQIANNHS